MHPRSLPRRTRSHGYERMSPTAGFTGLRAAWLNASIPGNATFASALTGSFPQVQSKPFGVTANSGTTHVVAGSGGQLSSATLQFPSKAAVAGTTVSCALDFTAVTMRLRRAQCSYSWSSSRK